MTQAEGIGTAGADRGMAEGGGVLQRKLALARARVGQAPPERDPRPALALALARAAQDMMALPLRMPEATLQDLSLAELADHLPDRALLAVLEGSGGALGVLALDPALVAGLIEMQMLGRIGSAELVPRRPTRTDAAMVSGFIDRVLGLTGGICTGFRYLSHLDDPRPLGLMLDDGAYRGLRLRIELGQGTAVRAGAAFLALPDPAPSGAEAAAAQAALAQDGAADEALRHWLLSAQADLVAVMARLRLPLAQALSLRAGDLLSLPDGALDGIELQDRGGQCHARARLGQANGHRALRLCVTEERGRLPSVARPLAPPGPGLTVHDQPVARCATTASAGAPGIATPV